MGKLRWASGIVVLAGLLAPPAGGAEPAFIERFTPSGVAKNVRQVTARFAAPMVALGDPRLAEPFDIECSTGGEGRWADTRNWVYDFETDLGAGERCTFRLKASLRTLAGAAPAAPDRARSYSFTTGGPAIVSSRPREGGQGVDEQQVFLLKLDAAADAGSIRANARCIVEGIGEQIPVQAVEGEERAAILRSQSIDAADPKNVLARCQRPLPPGAKLQLVWGKGIATTTGIANTADQTLAFQVREPFTARAECTRSNAKAGCLPMLPLDVRFSAPVPRALASAVRLKLANGKQVAPRLDTPGEGTVESIAFDPPFAENVPVQVVLPSGFVDDAGRSLANASRFPLEVRVDAFPPLAKFSGSFGVLESKEGGVLPITVRNIEPKVLANKIETPAKLLRLEGDGAKVAEWMRRVEVAGEGRGELVEDTEASEDGPSGRWREDTGNRSVFGAQDGTSELQVPRPGNGRQSEVIGIPLKKPGFYVVEIESRILGRSLLGRDESRFVATSALVTNLSVHFKWGRESSLAWVTRLSDGAPVANAEVRILDWCNGQSQWSGRTDKDGIAMVPKSFGEPHDGNGCGYRSPLMVMATLAEDFAFTQTGWSQGIGPEEFRLRRNWDGQNDVQHTVLDRALFRAGETVSMKHFLRVHTITGVATPPNSAGSRTVVIRHSGSGQEYTSSVAFGADGIAESQWKIPAEARLGDYQVVLKEREREITTGAFKVEQFRLPTMRATVGGSPVPLVRPRSADLDLHVAWLSGGGAAGLPVRVRTVVQRAPVQFAEYEDFTFGGAPVAEGVVNETGNEMDFDADGEGADAATPTVTAVTLDGAGGARVTIGDLPEITQPSRLVAELEYADGNGELMTASRSIGLVPASLNLGVRRESWAGSTSQLRFRVVALDLAGKPAAGRAVSVSLYGATRYSFRKRLVGGFYGYETTRETRRLAATCQGRTDAEGLITCDVAPAFSGEVLIRAEAADAEGRITGATASAWIYDGDEAWFGGTSGDRMDVLPEQKAYEAGDTARFQVRLPFRQAQALVTVEREGVISGFVRKLDAKSPLVEVPITAEHAPNAFVSVLAVRGRVARAEPSPDGKRVARGDQITGLVDLNKPAFRLGMAGVKVGWKPHRLDVAVSADKAVYKVREHAAVKVQVKRADGAALPTGTEVAFAAVDSALLRLYPNASWELLAAMMGERGIDVLTSTAQLQVVGKRHYGRKAVPSGGSGGRDAARELFDSLLFWQGRVRVDAQGVATVNVPLNDSLSEFRLVAIANGGASFFGTGSTTITTTQDLILQSGLPAVVREGDGYLATVSVRNTTNAAVNAELSGTRTAAGKAQALSAQRVSLEPGQSRDVSWRVNAPVGADSMAFDIRAQAGGTTDRVRVPQQVIAPFPVRTWQATLLQLDGTTTLPLQRPAGALPGRGNVEVTLRAKLGDGLDGVTEFFRFYPYNCMEQLVSRAVVLGEGWDAAMSRLPAYLDRDGLVRFFPTEAVPGEDSLTAYILAVAHEAGLGIPDGVRTRMLAGLRGFVEGRVVRSSALPTADLTIRKLAALDALARHGEATPAMVTSVSIEPRLWPTSAVIDWLNLTRRLEGLPRASARRAEAEQVLRTRLNFQGTTMTFSTEKTDRLWWLMISGDVNANRLLLAVQELPTWRDDIPRVVRGALGRQQGGRWNTTVANAWGAVAMRKFSAKFETEAVTGRTELSYGARNVALDWPRDAKQREAALPWQDGPGTLTVTQQGTGKPWVQVRSLVAVPLTRPLSSGYRIERSVAPVEQRTPGRWSRGDVARVKLTLTAQSDMSWVVVDDPVPAGATLLGSGLGGQSQLLQRGEQRRGMVWAAFEERRFDGYRAYYRFVPKGTWTVEYIVRLNNPGTFVLPATRVEAMYAPEMFGESPNARVVVEP